MSSQPKDIIWFTPHPNHYHHYLMEKSKENGLEIDTVYFNKWLGKYPWKAIVDSKPKSLAKSFFGLDLKAVFKSYSNYKTIIIAGWGEPTMVLLLTCLALRSKSFYLYTDTPSTRKRSGLKQKVRNIWLHWIWRNSAGILTTGKPGLDFFINQGVAREKLFNFPFVTNLDFFKPAEKSKRNEVIFSSGRLDIAHKGYDVALAALSMNNDQFTYEVAGTGPDEEVIKGIIKNLSLEQKVSLLGWMETNDLLKLYQDCRIFLHPSNFDPFPNAVLEAMACGCIVVASDLAGSAKDRIKDGVNGFLFTGGDANSLYDKLHIAIHLDNENEDSMRAAARATAEKWNYMYNIETLNGLID